ncbi:hypothetical protein MMC25_004076 [Agyrium rufum]|nr:hypothetical protein [Agyrium rufum]
MNETSISPLIKVEEQEHLAYLRSFEQAASTPHTSPQWSPHSSRSAIASTQYVTSTWKEEPRESWSDGSPGYSDAISPGSGSIGTMQQLSSNHFDLETNTWDWKTSESAAATASTIVEDPLNQAKICHICLRVFSRRFDLKTHLKTHDKNRELPHACDERDCGRRFARKVDLERHIRCVSTPVHTTSFEDIHPRKLYAHHVLIPSLK